MYVADIGVKCPQCGVSFNSRQLPIILDTGLRNSELRQDFRGVLPQLEQFAVCTCPNCGKADWVNSFQAATDPPALNQVTVTPHLQFRTAALNAERDGKGSFQVGLLYLHAAWCADDTRAFPQAREYRRLACEAFQRSLNDGTCPFERRGEIEYLIGELYRRAGEFDSCQQHYGQVIGNLPGKLALMARKLMKLAEKGSVEPVQFDSIEGEG